jgi:hypothetical protein
MSSTHGTRILRQRNKSRQHMEHEFCPRNKSRLLGEHISSIQGTRILCLRNTCRLIREQEQCILEQISSTHGTRIEPEEQISSTRGTRIASEEQISSTGGTLLILPREQEC